MFYDYYISLVNCPFYHDEVSCNDFEVLSILTDLGESSHILATISTEFFHHIYLCP